MKKTIAFVVCLAFTAPAHAFLGIGDVTFDPSTYGEVVKQYEQMMKLYENAKGQLDKLASIEKTINDAQTAAQTLGSFNLKTATSALRQNTNSIKSAADLRAAVANTEGGVANNASYVQYQLYQINQLDQLAALQKASADNAQQAASKGTSTATSQAIAAQSSATLAALAAAQEQRRIQEETQRGISAKAALDNMKNSGKVYEAMGK